MAKLPGLLIDRKIDTNSKAYRTRVEHQPISEIILQHIIVEQHAGCPVGYTQCGNNTVDRNVDVDGGMFQMEMPHIKCCNDATELCAPDDTNPYEGRCISRNDLANKLSNDTTQLPLEVTHMIASRV